MQSQLKVLAPVITRDVTLPNSSKKISMLMVPVPDSKTLMAIPMSTINNMTGAKDELQARDLLTWDNGVGTLDGCDLRFKINQLGCLELLDSEEDEDSGHANPARSNHHQNRNQQTGAHPYDSHYQTGKQTLHQNPKVNRGPSAIKPKQNSSQLPPLDQESAVSEHSSTNNSNMATNHRNNNSNNSNSSSGSSASSAGSNSGKKANIGNKIKQISPGCSLLRDGPDYRRPRTSSSAAPIQNAAPTAATTHTTTSTPLSVTKRVETTANQDSVVLEKLLPKKQLDELKSGVENWSIEDVKSFVDSIPGCAGNGHLFESQQICGKSLLYLDQKDLVELVNVKLGPAIKIYNAIALLKS